MSRADWERLAAFALERGALDEVDRALIDTLAAKAFREDDLAFRLVLACLVGAVREGGLRIPLGGPELEACLARWLRGLYAAASAAPAAPGDPRPADWPEPASLAARMAEDFTAARLAGAYDSALGRPDAYLPLIHFGGGLYFQRHHAAEALAGARLRADAARPPRVKLAAPTGRAAQRLAESLRQGLASLDGPDGSATGQAADEAVAALPCSTLHALLRYQPATGDFFHHAHRPLPADLVLIDEVSMVDIFLLARLLDALEDGACLVLLGDMDQLPSVEAGSVLADLAPAGAGPHPLRGNLAVLDRSHRSGASILHVTRAVNAMDAGAALEAMLPPAPADAPPWPRPGDADPSGPPPGCRMVLPPGRAGHRQGLEACLESWLAFHYLGAGAAGRAPYGDLIGKLCALDGPDDPARDGLLAGAFAYLDQARILTFTRKGWHGAAHINRLAGERLRRLWDPRGPRDPGAGFAGSPLLVLENDAARGLFNGDVGLQARIGGRDLAWFRRADGFHCHPIAFLPRHETAFASTVHKAQGSEYDQVLLVLPEAGNRLLFKETLYTALTRARRFAGIYGPEEVLREAIGRKVVRESGLAAYLAATRPSGTPPVP